MALPPSSEGRQSSSGAEKRFAIATACPIVLLALQKVCMKASNAEREPNELSMTASNFSRSDS